MHQILKLEVFHQSHTRIPSGNEASAFEDFWKPGGQTFPGNMPEAIIDEVPWGEFTIRKLGGD